MKIEKYICDFCKKEIEKENIKKFYTYNTAQELCDECYLNAINLKTEYEEKCDKLYDEYKNKILSMKR